MTTSDNRARTLILACGVLIAAGCSSDATTSSTAPVVPAESTVAPTVAPTDAPTTDAPTIDAATTDAPATDVSDAASAEVTFTAEVWADNWFSLSVNGTLVGEDSVPITTERSFNAETITFTASYPLTIALVSKDFKETDSGLEYIGTDRQQMGDGGVIAQITDTSTGTIVATTSADWRGLVIHTAPTNVECVTSDDPDTDCLAVIGEEPDGWATAGFDDSDWTPATVYTADEVGAKDGYTEIQWDPAAQLIWTSSLKQDNTILWRTVVTAG